MNRTCGACTLCCTALAVPELDKPNGVPCKHLTPHGCGIYEERPESCRAFACAFLQGAGDLSSRPDRTGAVVSAEDGGFGEGAEAIVLYTVPGDERWSRSKYLSRIIRESIARGSGTFIIAGDSRRLFTNPRSRLADILRKAGISMEVDG